MPRAKKTKSFDMKGNARAIKGELFDALKASALKNTSTTAGMAAAQLLVSMMALEEEAPPAQTVLNIRFAEIFSDEDGNVRTKPTTQSPVTPASPTTTSSPSDPPQGQPSDVNINMS